VPASPTRASSASAGGGFDALAALSPWSPFDLSDALRTSGLLPYVLSIAMKWPAADVPTNVAVAAVWVLAHASAGGCRLGLLSFSLTCGRAFVCGACVWICVDVCGMCVGCVWDVCGMCVGCVWDVCGMCVDVCGMCLGCVWDVSGICLGCVWDVCVDVCGMCVGCVLHAHFHEPAAVIPGFLVVFEKPNRSSFTFTFTLTFTFTKSTPVVCCVCLPREPGQSVCPWCRWGL
jgi:hypothetical protein